MYPFFSEDTCLRVVDDYNRRSGHEVFESVEVYPLFDSERRDVVIHLYNPFLEKEMVRLFPF